MLKRRNAEAMSAIAARELRKTFGTTVALDGIDLHVEEGASSDSSVPTVQARPPYSTRFSALSHMRVS
jgi:hypothetical protein